MTARRTKAQMFAPLALMLVASLATGAPAAEDAGVHSIAVIVNDQPISNYDLDQYVRFFLATAAVPNTPENVARFRPQSLRRLIEDVLQNQEARRLSIEITEQEVEAAIDGIVQQNGIERSAFEDMLSRNNVSLATLQGHIYSDIAWSKVIRQNILPKVLVRESRIDTAVAQARAASQQPRYLLSEIFLGFDADTSKARVKALADELALYIRNEDAPFGAVASRFSEAPSALRGGDMGWVLESVLQPDLRKSIMRMQKGDVSDPVPVLNGFYIFFMRDRHSGDADARRSRVSLLSLSLPDARNVGSAAAQAARARKNFSTCADAKAYAEAQNGRARDMGDIPEADLSPDVHARLRAVSGEGAVLRARRGREGLSLLLLCGRTRDAGTDISRERIELTLFNQKTDMLARRHLRDLRRNAHIESR